MFVRIASAAAALALMSGAAMAQSTAPQAGAPVNPDPTAAAPADQTMPAEQQAALKAGDPNVVSNPPVADTPENRKLYGKPLSNAGKHSAPKGN